MEILLGLMVLGLLVTITLGVEDTLYWRNFQPEPPVRVQVFPAMWEDSLPTRDRQSLPAWGREATA